MKTVFDKAEYEDLVNRIGRLNAGTKGLWGKMTANQMVCHASDLIRDLMGVRQVEILTPPEMRSQIIAMVITENEWDKNLQTFPPYSQEEGGGGTRPTDFESDRQTLLDLVSQIYHAPEDYRFHPHAGLGVLEREQAGVFVWKHTDHHLREFGV